MFFRPIGAVIGAAVTVCVASGAFAQTKVRVGNVNTVSDVPIYIADKKGYFKQEGLDVEFISFNTAARMIAPLGAGQLDVGGGTVSAGLYNAVSRGIGIRIVADKGSSRPPYNFSQLMVRKDLVDSGRYKTFKDLKGMKVAIAAVGTGNGATLNQALKMGGLKFSDVTTVDLGFPDHLIGYRNKAIDAGITNEPTATQAEREGVAVKVEGNDELFKNHQTAVLLYSDDFAKNHPDAALKFMRAYIRAARDYNDALKDGSISGKGADDVIATLVEYTKIKDPKLHRDTVPAAINPDGHVDIESLEGDLAFFKEQKLIQKPDIKSSDVVNHSFVDKVVAELGPYKKPN
jgi:NitT/TauT family transport system substrate-binding protein